MNEREEFVRWATAVQGRGKREQMCCAAINEHDRRTVVVLCVYGLMVHIIRRGGGRTSERAKEGKKERGLITVRGVNYEP